MLSLATALTGLFFLSGGAGAAAVPVPAAPTPALPAYSVRLTAYNAVAGQTDGDPSVTASGAFANPEVVVARSRDLAEELPFGTIIEVQSPDTAGSTCGLRSVAHQIGYRVVADTMNARFSDSVDILFDTVQTSKTFGVCDARVRVVGHLDDFDPAHLPTTQKALAALVAGA